MKVYFSSRDKITKNEQLEQFFAGSIMEIPLEISWASGDVSSNTSLLLAVYGFITNAIFCIYRHRGALYLLPPGDTHLFPIQSTYSFYIHLKLWHHFGPFQEMVSYGKHYDPQHFWLLSLYQVCFQPTHHQFQFQPVTHLQCTFIISFKLWTRGQPSIRVLSGIFENKPFLSSRTVTARCPDPQSTSSHWLHWPSICQVTIRG